MLIIPEPDATEQEAFATALRLAKSLQAAVDKLLEKNEQDATGQQRQLLEAAQNEYAAQMARLEQAQRLGPAQAAATQCSFRSLTASTLTTPPVDMTEEHWLDAHVVPCLSAAAGRVSCTAMGGKRHTPDET